MYFGRMGFYWDPTYILIIIGAVLSLLASAMVKSSFSKYSRVPGSIGMTGAQVAQRILDYAGIDDVSIVHIHGNLTDHYDPRKKQVGLSDSVYAGRSISAIAVAAHECGHVIQHAQSYKPLSIRTALVPVANFGSGASWFFIIGGFIFQISGLILAGIILFSAAVLFQLVTLPVEFNASGRALKILSDIRLVNDNEKKAAGKVLRAAALTYVASAASAILQLLRLILIFNRSRD